jgi:hypothetical protein
MERERVETLSRLDIRQEGIDIGSSIWMHSYGCTHANKPKGRQMSYQLLADRENQGVQK